MESKRHRFYGRRRGHKLRQGRRDLLEDLLPKLRLDAKAGLAGAFAAMPPEIWLEIGFGGGEHLAAQAESHPDIGFIGCEPFINGVAGLLVTVAEKGLTNIRIFDDDARELLNVLPENSIAKAFILFPDPWPKKRHHRRRFIGPETLDHLSRLMKDGAELRFASDHMGYASWTLEHVTRHGDFAWPVSRPADWRERPGDWVETRYEMKALAKGKACAYFRFYRRSRL
ncbi:MAG TPA: tRNA (guanosine(46)-N7)-methyltransferase TrmB [Rhodospirillales bacterium]|nr:tRNA (guanosine(46)-N7)-methyltransferase TrmB [Rhodospirillales bacterium]